MLYRTSRAQHALLHIISNKISQDQTSPSTYIAISGTYLHYSPLFSTSVRLIFPIYHITLPIPTRHSTLLLHNNPTKSPSPSRPRPHLASPSESKVSVSPLAYLSNTTSKQYPGTSPPKPNHYIYRHTLISPNLESIHFLPTKLTLDSYTRLLNYTLNYKRKAGMRCAMVA